MAAIEYRLTSLRSVETTAGNDSGIHWDAAPTGYHTQTFTHLYQIKYAQQHSLVLACFHAFSG